jgi:hypothetical protein
MFGRVVPVVAKLTVSFFRLMIDAMVRWSLFVVRPSFEASYVVSQSSRQSQSGIEIRSIHTVRYVQCTYVGSYACV